MSVAYPELEDYVALATLVLGVDVDAVLRAARLDLAESALHAPRAEFEGVEFYPAFEQKVAVLLSRLINNHPFPDGNKRCAMACAQLFVAMNGLQWHAPDADADDADESLKTLLSVAAGSVSEDELAAWVAERLRAS